MTTANSYLEFHISSWIYFYQSQVATPPVEAELITSKPAVPQQARVAVWLMKGLYAFNYATVTEKYTLLLDEFPRMYSERGPI